MPDSSVFIRIPLKRPLAYILRFIFTIGAIYFALDIYESIKSGVVVQRGGSLVFVEDSAGGFWLRVINKITAVAVSIYVVFAVKVRNSDDSDEN